MTAPAAAPAPSSGGRVPPWRDLRVLRVAWQVVFLAAVVGLLWFLWNNLVTNAERIGLSLGFGFLGQPAGIQIPGSAFRPTQAVRDALWVGVANTLRVALIGIALATLIGLVVGVARLSRNWLVRKTAEVYVETLRNVPVLVWIFFLYIAVLLRLPPITEPIEWAGVLLLSNRGLFVPWGAGGTGAGTFAIVLGLGLVLAAGVWIWRTRRRDATGEPARRVLYSVLVLLVVGAVGYVALGAPVTLSLPARDGRVVEGGIGLGIEYAALLIALVLYTASHIAEIVRGSILAVPRGQGEAADAIGLSGFQRLRYVILPQAMRIAVPPLANQYLNLTKNSSLAFLVGFQELFRLTQTFITNGAPAPPAYAILMLAYLALSLTIALFANLVNRALAYRER